MRSLWVEVLPTLRITGSGVHASLISLVRSNLGAVVIAAIVTVGSVVTIAAVITVAIGSVIAIAIVAVVSIIAAIIAVPTLILVAPPVPVSILVINTITIATLVLRVAIISIVPIIAILRLCCRAGRDKDAENKREARYHPTDPCSEIIFHDLIHSPFPRVDYSKLGAVALLIQFTLTAM